MDLLPAAFGTGAGGATSAMDLLPAAFGAGAGVASALDVLDAAAAAAAAAAGAAAVKAHSKPRAERACLPCAASRRRCEGTVPGSTACDVCTRRGIVCTFPEGPPKKRGPKRGPRGEESAKSILRSLAMVGPPSRAAAPATAAAAAAAGGSAASARDLGLWSV